MALLTTDLLDIDYVDTGPANAPAVLLLHGWPDDRSTWDEVVPALQVAGFRIIVPSLRGFGDTRFRDDQTLRTGNSGVHALDMFALLDGIGVERVAIVGHDWGANIAEAMAVARPDHVHRLAMLSTPPRLGGMATPPFWHAQRQWYHWFMATERGAQAVRDDPIGFAHIHWCNWSPAGWFDEATFAKVARSFANPDWVDVTLHSYRARWDEAEPDPASRWLEEQVKATTSLSLPTLYLHGAEDGVNPPATAAQVAAKFTGWFRRVELPGVGHFPQRENPPAVIAALLDLLGDTDESARSRTET